MNESARQTILPTNVMVEDGYYTRDFSIKNQGLTSTTRTGILLKVSNYEQ